ncbi:LAFA_0E16292g1_1 [Lachancea sp. 'fantastica']|nr:LAFA_0E16292g1_1 [Lachancea sp. 'fantastica']
MQEDIFVPNGEDTCVRLTLVSTFQEISQVCKYVSSIQDTFSVELESCETITQNLKMSCVSHGANCKNCPLLILEYDQNSRNYALWKSSGGEWALGTTLARFLAPHSTCRSKMKLNLAKLESYFETCQISAKHDRKFLIETLQKLNIDWQEVPFDFQVFQEELTQSIESQIHEKSPQSQESQEPQESQKCQKSKESQKPQNYIELVSPLQYKSLITMAVLKTQVRTSQRRLETDLHAYDKRMRALEGEEIDFKSTKEPQARDSREASIFSDTTLNSGSPIDDEYAISSRQLMTNFNEHFKGIAESFETFDVQKSAPRTVRKWKVGKPVKNSKSDSKGLRA